MQNHLKVKSYFALASVFLFGGAAFGFAGGGTWLYKGPSSSDPPYVVPVKAKCISAAILTVGDSVNDKPDGTPYRLVGIPDGLGAYENEDGTFTLLVNHELTGSDGIPRAHSTSGAGSFISKWQIRKMKKGGLEVLHGEDQIQTVSTFNRTTGLYNPPAKGEVFDRLCSANLPEKNAFKSGSRGFEGRIYMNGEEVSEGQAWAHVLTGSSAGVSYELPRFGRMAFENQLTHPSRGNKTIVALLDDTSPGGQVYIYIGEKTAFGNPVERAGLNNGTLYGVKVTEIPAEVRETGIPSGTTFELSSLGDVSALSGAELETQSHSLGVTQFLRPEDGNWDSTHPNDFYFVTTDRYDQVKDGVGSQIGRSRLYRLRFTDHRHPELGGSVDMLLDGTEAQNMMDNLTIDRLGRLLIQEDTGNVAHNAKLLQYDIATDSLSVIAMHDPFRFGDIGKSPAVPFTIDEESSGIIDAQDILGRGWFLLDQQAHYTLADPELVQGGQILAFFNPRDEDVEGDEDGE